MISQLSLSVLTLAVKAHNPAQLGLPSARTPAYSDALMLKNVMHQMSERLHRVIAIKTGQATG
jgi:hypothetical protein